MPLPTSKKPDAPPLLNMSWKPLASPSVWELATSLRLPLLRLAALNQTETVKAGEVTVSVEFDILLTVEVGAHGPEGQRAIHYRRRVAVARGVSDGRA